MPYCGTLEVAPDFSFPHCLQLYSILFKDMANILLVEDDVVLGKSLQVALEIDGYEVHWVDTLAGARASAQKASFDLVILDLNLPDGLGLAFAKEAQESWPAMPILMLTASNDEDSVVAGFEAGAVDYVKKPFSNKELKARIRVALKDKGKPSGKVLQYGGIVIQPEKRLAKFGEQVLDLNRREFDILSFFVAQAESVVTRENILRLLDKEGEIFDRTIDSHVSHLRSRLRKAGLDSVQISPVYGVGYRLEKK
jgi:two-component system OmpR family response regulator